MTSSAGARRNDGSATTAREAADALGRLRFQHEWRKYQRLILDLFEQYCGARLTLNCMRPGGLPHDLPVGWTDKCRELVELFPAKFDEYEGLLTNNRIWKKRTVGIGGLPPEGALDSGVSSSWMFRAPAWFSMNASGFFILPMSW